MLDLPRYLLGVAEIGLLTGFAALGAASIRSRLLPDLEGAPAHLATAVLGLALAIWSAELLGSFGLLDPVPLLLMVSAAGVGAWAMLRRVARGEGGRGRPRPQCPPHPATGPAGRGIGVPALIALAIAAVALVKFGLELKPKLSTGMTGFDSTWYHGTFAAGFFQSGDTWDLHFIAPQFLAWFYPANSELFHGIGMLAFDRDLLSPLLNFGWLVGCLVACWCIGRPYGVAPWSLALGAMALSVPAFADQAGEARNDIVGTFFLLAAVAIALNAWPKTELPSSLRLSSRIARGKANSAVVVGLAAGLAAGTKLNFLLPAAVLVLGLSFVAPIGERRRALLLGGLAALAGGGYWYLRNLAHSGNPLPWFDGLGPISLPSPDQPLGGREGHSVLGYLLDGGVWSEWFLPGLHDGLWAIWPALLALALSGLVLALLPARPARQSTERRLYPDRFLLVAGLAGSAAMLAWFVAPTSASGPDGMPRGFESGLRYLVPALVLGSALLPPALLPWCRYRARGPLIGGLPTRRLPIAGALACLAAIAIGYPVQRHYLENRYESPTFAAPGLNAAFAWATPLSDARIATTGTRQYPLYGTDLSNRVEFVGVERPHGGFTSPTACPQWRRLLDAADYDYVVATRDRVEPGKPPYPPTAEWTEGPEAEVVLRTPPTVVFELRGSLDPSRCPDARARRLRTDGTGPSASR